MKKTVRFFIGIDVSKPHFDAALLQVINYEKQEIHNQRFDNDSSGLKSFKKWLKSLGVTFNNQTLVVIENTGVYHRLLWSFCADNELPIYIGNAAHIKWSFGIARGKNDVIDSKRLCLYAYKEADSLKASPKPNPAILKLKDLYATRSSLLKSIGSIKRHLGELKKINHPEAQKTLENVYKKALKGLKESISEANLEIEKTIKSCEQLQKNYRLLLTVPGIGKITALYLICSTINFAGNPSGKQLACYAGVVPFENSSGISVKGKKRVHKMANKELKSLLFMSALTVINNNKEFKAYYNKKLEEGKHKLAVINAIKNKIILRAVAVINSQKPYQNNYMKNAA